MSNNPTKTEDQAVENVKATEKKNEQKDNIESKVIEKDPRKITMFRLPTQKLFPHKNNLIH